MAHVYLQYDMHITAIPKDQSKGAVVVADTHIVRFEEVADMQEKINSVQANMYPIFLGLLDIEKEEIYQSLSGDNVNDIYEDVTIAIDSEVIKNYKGSYRLDITPFGLNLLLNKDIRPQFMDLQPDLITIGVNRHLYKRI